MRIAYRPILIAAATVLAMFVWHPAVGQTPVGLSEARDPEANTDSTTPDMHALVKYFDFDERKLHYFEPTPMDWEQLRGVGLPEIYANGRFDEEVGHAAPPSFRLDIATGNVGYEYRSLNLTVIPDSDYLIEGFIRAENLKYAGAFMTAYFVDRFGDAIAGSHRVSRIIRAVDVEEAIWQRVKVNVPGNFPQAQSLRLQFWILQDHVWKAADPHEIDPIKRSDVYARAWFDDFSIYSLPRLTMRLSNPAGLVLPDAQERLELEVNNATALPLRMRMRIEDSEGVEHMVKDLAAPPLSSPQVFQPDEALEQSDAGGLAQVGDARKTTGGMCMPLPPLPPGYYTAELSVLGGDRAVMKRTVNFSVLARLAVKNPHYLELGVDLGRWRGGDQAGVRDLLAHLGCGSIKIGIPMTGAIEGAALSSYFKDLSDLLRTLAEQRLDVTGVMLPVADNPAEVVSTLDLVERDEAWKGLFGPVFAHFGVLLPAWQLGAEAAELHDGRAWTDEAVDKVRGHLKRFISIPKIAVPQALSAVTETDADVASVWAPSDLPASALPYALDFLLENRRTAYWLHLDRDEDQHLTAEGRAGDLARRLVLSKSLNPSRIYLPAPFELSESGGRPAWRPKAEYAVYRTLYHYLAGKTASAVMRPAPDALAILFLGPDSSTLIAWSEREDETPRFVELYLGDHPRAVSLWGEARPLEVVEGRARIPLTATPVIIDSLDTPLARLQASYRLEPKQIQIHAPEPRPTLTFENTFESQLSGQIRLTPPEGWVIKPIDRTFTLNPGEQFSQVLTLEIPPRQIARPHKLRIELELFSPTSMTLIFDDLLQIGLRDIKLDASLYWQGDDLVLRQTLMNLSPRTVNFGAYCEPAGHTRQERFFYGVKPGDVAVQTYLFPRSRNLMDTLIPIGIEEIGGSRSLIQFAEVPQ